MPKIKTHKGAKRRFHITGSGKIMRVKGGKSHLRRRKPKRVRYRKGYTSSWKKAIVTLPPNETIGIFEGA